MEDVSAAAAAAAEADAAARWTQTRENESAEPPSEAPTPAPESGDANGASASYFSRPPASSSTPSFSAATESGGSGSATPAVKSTNVDTEDEDVRIAIMALGAMKNLDGKTEDGALERKSRAHTQDASSGSRLSSIERRDRDSSHTCEFRRYQHLCRPWLPPLTHALSPLLPAFAWPSSGISTSSVTSTAISSPSSTPTTEFTQPSISASSGSIVGGANSGIGGSDGRASSSSSTAALRAATLADLPADFEFPAVVRDEDGNEVEVDQEMLRDADFLNRVSHLPIVRGTLRAYELGKQRSKIVKYGGDLVESGVKAISRPVVGRLGASLGERGKEQLDDFACRQLDRLYPSAAGTTSKEERQRLMAELDEREKTEWAHMDEEERAKRRRAYWALHMEEKEREAVVSELRQRKGKPAGSTSTIQAPPSGQMITHDTGDSQYEAVDEKFRDGDTTMSPPASTSAGGASGQVTRRQEGRSRAGTGTGANTPSAQMSSTILENAARTGASSGWSSMLVEAGATAGGLSAAMSEESMKSLKYCLQWLQYATAHIEHQITVLRDLIVKLNHGELELTSPAAQNLTQIKGDVVNTIRSVVDVVGKYAGGALPEPARVSVKAFILSLPARWATVNRPTSASSGGGSSQFGTSPASPSFSPAHLSGGPSADRSSTVDRTGQMSAAATAQAANRVLTLAVESLDILRSVTVVVGESLDRADVWVERLRMIGIQRKRQHDRDGSGNGRPYYIEDSSSGWESARGLSAQQRHARRGSIGAGSDMSMGTSASTKRRRMRASQGVGANKGDDDRQAQAMKSPSATPFQQLKSTGPTMIGGQSAGSTAIATSPRQAGGAASSGMFNIGSAGGGGDGVTAGGTVERRRRRTGAGKQGGGGIGDGSGAATPTR